MLVSIIVARAENRVIGRAGGLPWKLKGDLAWFKQTTLGKPVIMGRRTFQSIGRPLPGRTNIVISRDPAFAADGTVGAASLEAALGLAREAGADEAMVIGGAEIYALALPLADRLYLTEVHAAVDGDTLFPEIDRTGWREVSREERAAETEGGPAYGLVVLERTDAGTRARRHFEKEGFYCAESVLRSIGETFPDLPAVPVRIATGLCSGMGRTSGTCGALTGGILALGLGLGRDDPSVPVDRTYAAVRDLIAEFEATFGGRDCTDLLGCDLGTGEGRDAFRARNLKSRCLGYAETVARLVERRLRGNCWES